MYQSSHMSECFHEIAEHKAAGSLTNGASSDVDDTWSNGRRRVGRGDVPVDASLHRPIIGYINLIRTLQKLTKGSPTHLLMLHHIKAEQVLKRILTPAAPGLLRFYALKLMKSLVRFQSSQWRTGTPPFLSLFVHLSLLYNGYVNPIDNSGIISEIYSTLRLDVCDDWLKMEKPDKASYDKDVRTLRVEYIHYFLPSNHYKCMCTH
jgi:hypothetical protein